MDIRSTIHESIPVLDDPEADTLNDETFGDCDLDAIKIKSDFGENGEFLGDHFSDNLPDFFQSDPSSSGFDLIGNDDLSQQPSIDALLEENSLNTQRPPINLRSSTINPLFSMAISQAPSTNQENIFPPPSRAIPPPPMPVTQQQINYQLLKRFEQSMINEQIPAQERAVRLRALIEKMQRDHFNGHERPAEINTNPFQQQQQQQHPMVIGEMMERARLTAMNNPTPPVRNPPMISSQLMDAIQRSDQIPPSSSTPHENPPRHNRPSKHYPRPPCLNTWQGRGNGHDEFAGLMGDREKQWVVKIQLHQVSQTKEEDFYFQKWAQQKKQQSTQLNRHDHRGQYITYPVLQLLKSIQQEKELADRLSQSSAQIQYSNVNPIASLPYATPLNTQLGKQSNATPRHPKCILDLGGEFTLGRGVNSITNEKYHLGLLLHIENLYRDVSSLEENDPESKFDSIFQRYFNDSMYFFPDMFGQHRKCRALLSHFYQHLSKDRSKNRFSIILGRIYGSLSYITAHWSNNFQIEPSLLTVMGLMMQELNNFQEFLTEINRFYSEQVQPKLHLKGPFSHPSLFTNSFTTTILIDLLLNFERRSYSPKENEILQQLQPHLQYQISDEIRQMIDDICQSLINCVPPNFSPSKILQPFGQIQHPSFNSLRKFLRIQTTSQIFTQIEPKLIFACIKDQ